MRDFAEQLFIALLVETFVVVLFSFKFKDRPRQALTILVLGTALAGLVAFFPIPTPTASISVEPHTTIKFVEITETRPPPTIETEIANTQAIIQVTPTIENEVNNWSSILSVRMPTLNEIRAEVPISIWDANILDVRDMRNPGVDNYSGEAQIGREYLFPTYWCATTSDLLTQNMDYINTVFLINGKAVPEKYVFNFNYDTSTGWKCNYDAIVIGGWNKNTEYILEIKLTLLKDLSDGRSSYPPGEYIYID